MMVEPLAVSIIINTDGRAASLRNTLESLRYLRYPRFEVVVVSGPTADGTREMLEAWRDRIKIGHCPQCNLSQSRNIGIALSSGKILAFIDDDALPEPEWLDDVIPAFSDPVVGVAGGFVHDHTGKGYQYRFSTVDRFATANWSWQRATPEFNFPFSFQIPYAQGTNSFFQRGAVIEVGGFDEEYEYYADETDLICRMIDSGWRIAQLDRGFVHHKYLASHLRNQHRVVTNWYPIIKNKAYFSLINGRGYATMERIVDEVKSFIDRARHDVRWAIENNLLAPEFAEHFERDADRALQDGLARGLRGKRRIAAAAALAGDSDRFLPFLCPLPAARQRCFVFLSQDYPPEPLGGIGRYVHLLVRLIAARGHQVHVLTRGRGHDRIDFDEGAWVHRCVVREYPQPQPSPGAAGPLPAHIWNYSMTMLAEAKEIASRRPIDCVHAPIWDAEAIAFLRDGSFPLITSLHTTLAMFLDSRPELRRDANFMATFAEPMLTAEKELFGGSSGILANSKAIIREIEDAYGLRFAPERLRIVPHGLDDWSRLPAELPDPIEGGMVRVVFIGRLEERKGIDVLMRITPRLFDRHPEVWLDIVGADRSTDPEGRSWCEIFEAHLAGHPGHDRIVFRGAVSEERLRGFYQAADIVVAPSRFESFGLVYLEAMVFGRAVVGCRTGGAPEMITDGRTGLLAEPGDEISLCGCIDRLLEDPELRRRLGEAARAEYLARFSAERMAAEEEGLLLAVASRSGRRGARPGLTPPPIVHRPALSPRRSGGPPRIAIIGGIVARYDGISDDIVNTWRYLREETDWEVSILATGSDYEGVPTRIVSGVAKLLMTPEFLSADVLLYHFGIWSPVFDALPVGNGRARQAVFFHNITPPEFVPPTARGIVERSFKQLHNLRHADRLWPVSRVNYELLRELDFEPDRIDILPVAVAGPALARLDDRPPIPIDILCLGRIVPSKGVRDLIAAVALIRQRSLPPFRVKIAGNLTFSDRAYCDSVRQDIAHGLADIVEIVGTVTPAERDRLLHAAHIVAIPSYHEGFCKSAIEGLRAGCVPVGYAAYNLRYIADRLCRMVAPGNIADLADALADTIGGIAAALADPGARFRLDRGAFTAAEFTAAARAHIDQFSPERIAALTRLRVSALLGAHLPSCSRKRPHPSGSVAYSATATDVEALHPAAGRTNSLTENDCAQPNCSASEALAILNTRLDRLEALAQRAGAVYVGNGRLLTRANFLDLVYLVEADDRLIVPRFAIDGIYEAEVTNFFLRNIGPDHNCLDVGANFGYYSCLMGKAAYRGKTLALEPDRRVFELLRDNIHINWAERVIKPIHAAAATEEGTLTLHRRLTRSGNTSIAKIPDEHLAELGEAASESFEIAAMPVDKLLPEFGGRIDFVKVDVEGAEPLVFRGMRETIACNKAVRIVMEWSPEQLQAAGFEPTEFTADLKQMGLRAGIIRSDTIQPVSWNELIETSYCNILLTHAAAEAAACDHVDQFNAELIAAPTRLLVGQALNGQSHFLQNSSRSMAYPHLDFPALTKQHLRDAKLYASREDLIMALGFLHGGTIAEVGVAFGDFSNFLLQNLQPERFVAFDIFTIHEHPVVWGRSTASWLQGMTHLEFYRRRFADYDDKIVIEVGESSARLSSYPDEYFDMIYIDAQHTYEGVRQDAEMAKRKIKSDGVLIFNDYIMFDHMTQDPYGVVPVVNELITQENWRVIGFALQQHMFCDIAIRR